MMQLVERGWEEWFPVGGDREDDDDVIMDEESDLGPCVRRFCA